METFVPKSSNIASVSYDAGTKTMQIEFVQGQRYEYTGVPPEIYFGIQHAPSAGQYFMRQIKDSYSYEQI